MIDYHLVAFWSRIVSSALLFGLMIYLFYRVAQPIIAHWQEVKNAEIADNEQRRDRALQQVAQAERELGDADLAAAAMIERAARDTLRERERIVSDATAEGERVVRNAKAELGRGRYAARDRLRAEILERALEIARQTASSTIDSETDRRLIDGVIAAVEPAAPEAAP